MGAIQLPDDLQRVIERHVAEGKASDPAAFLEEAVRRLLEETTAEENEILEAVEAGVADIAAGRYVTIETKQDQQRFHDAMMARLQASLSADP